MASGRKRNLRTWSAKSGDCATPRRETVPRGAKPLPARIPSARICGTLLRSASGLVVTLLLLACTRSICMPGRARSRTMPPISTPATSAFGTPDPGSEKARVGGPDLNTRDVDAARLAGKRRQGERVEHERQADQHRRHQVDQGRFHTLVPLGRFTIDRDHQSRGDRRAGGEVHHRVSHRQQIQQVPGARRDCSRNHALPQAGRRQRQLAGNHGKRHPITSQNANPRTPGTILA